MEEQYKKTFDQMVDSLKMYQRYELKDKNRKDILDKVYVDPIENDGILNLCLKDNTTVLRQTWYRKINYLYADAE